MESIDTGSLTILPSEGGISFVVPAVVDAFQIYLTALDVIGQSSLENMLDFNVPDGAAFHGEKIIFLINPAH